MKTQVFLLHFSDCDDHGFNTRQRHRQIKRQRWGQIKGQTQKKKHRVKSTLKIVRLNYNLEAFILHSNDCNDQGFNTRKTQKKLFLL